MLITISNFYTIDGFKIGKRSALAPEYNTVLQSAFFSIAKIIPEEDDNPLHEGCG